MPSKPTDSPRFSPLLLALLGLLLFLLPYGILLAHSYVTIDDNLDAELNIPYLLVHHGIIFDYQASATVPAIMDGLPRNALRSGLNAGMGLFALFPPWAAYLVQQALVRLLGLLGMYALLRQELLQAPRAKPVAAAIALCWAVLPLYAVYGLSVAGQPALLLAFLALRRRAARWWHWVIIVGFPLWSMFVFVGPFVLAALGGLWLRDWWRARRPNWVFLLGVFLLLSVYLLVEWPLFYSLLVARQFVPHRLEFDLAQLTPLGLKAGLRSAGQFFLMGQYHASRFLRVAVLLAIAVAVVLAPAGQRAVRWRRLLPWLLGLAGLALFSGFYPQLVALGQNRLPLLGVFNFGRFHFLAPLLWFWLLALALRYLSGRWQAVVVALQLLVGLGMNMEWLNNMRELAGRPDPHEPNYTAYVALDLFQLVQQTIRQESGLLPEQYRVACLGLPPAVAQLNNFYTLDSYQNNYPLAYKHRFRPIIAGELAKSPELRRYFDAWGNRCYLFSAELGKDFRVGAFQQRVVQDFAFDTAAFRRLGGRYVLSAAKLATPDQSGLQLAGVFEQPAAYWRIWLYKLKQ
ncbi:hypothetical protein KBK19_08865 [Microvirga sp. STR05]|uniref:Glycosyltransferase RgtA/B/C/D-like domain-containing protein n=1 Tax=Hymenobacter duratus TaxID=2771356 RepID=A0ABR8JE67_9BACT|nr:DUF6044 family protein [Hymenobacter duratus]MBD2715144.1 hypothetical protein [Hymenobacter duratus]MBR7950051.1 hypothetical protein [Microvirga sp. STR05]